MTDGMFGAKGTGDTSGYGGLVRKASTAGSSERPYGSYFDDVADDLERAYPGFSDAIERVVVDRGEITLHVKREKLVEVALILRLLVLGDELFCVRRENRGNWKSNVSQGGFATPHEPTFEQIAIAFKASQAIGGWMVGVDVLPTRDGRDMLLEVNAVPGWRATASALQVDMAQVVLRRLHALA